ncbi:MAG TPA: hypothetical protein VG963_07995 [Polyangiaceae bacterium]|nr:hypothetical protein [Polyangiaceae bacterium]
MSQNGFDPNRSKSRYRATPYATFNAPGRSVSWLLPRILPPLEEVPTTGRSVSVRPGERLDQLSARVLKDPASFWQLTDANSSLDPLRFTAERAADVEIPVPRVPR